MNLKSTLAPRLGRILSLALLLAAGPLASAKPDAWPFTRTADGSLGLTVTDYVCTDGLTVTLIPTLHFAEPDFYDAVDRLAGAADRMIYEGVRPPGFFGPPFEDDPRAPAPTDPRQITAVRLRSVATYVEAFRAAHHRDPTDLAEVYQGLVAPGAAEAFARQILVDYWGTPLLIKTRPSGQLVIMSRGADRQPGGDDFGLPLPAFDPRAAAPAQTDTPLGREVDAYARLGRSLGLSLQAGHLFASQWRPTSLNADISLDMLDTDLGLREQLPLTALTKIPRPAHAALVYGAAHAVALDRGLSGLGCRASHRETVVVIRADGPGARARTIAELLTEFSR